jgi:hypothetical protein
VAGEYGAFALSAGVMQRQQQKEQEEVMVVGSGFDDDEGDCVYAPICYWRSDQVWSARLKGGTWLWPRQLS